LDNANTVAAEFARDDAQMSAAGSDSHRACPSR
jgi:hypothetical protein